MSNSAAALWASYRVCRQISRQARSSFWPGFVLLPRHKRIAMHALYAFMRHTDDLADDPMPQHSRRQALTQWRAAMERALLGQFDPRGSQALRHEPEYPQWTLGRIILPALADTVRRYNIPADYLRMVIDGVEMDLTTRRYQTFDQLRAYCELVASAVGLACIHVWGFSGPQALEPARCCGIALQLTNILRDLRDDAEQGRIYLPLEDLQACGYSPEDLLAGKADSRFESLMRLEIARAEDFFRQGARLLELLARDGQRICGMTLAVYRELLRKIAARPAAVLQHRVQLPALKKLLLLLRWAVLPPRTRWLT